MVKLAMEGIIVRSDGKLLTILGSSENEGQALLHIQREDGGFRASPRELYRLGYRLVAAKPAIWDLWGSPVYGMDDGGHLWDEVRP